MENPRSAAAVTPDSASPALVSHAFYQADNYQPEESVGYMMRRILLSLAHSIETELAGSALTNAQWLPIMKLYLGHSSTAAELARDCQLDAGAMTRMLDRLEAKGLCSRSRSERDRRLVHIALTESGQRAAQTLPGVLSEVLNQHLAGMSAEEFATLKTLLQKMLSNGQALQAKSGPLQPDDNAYHP
jgi:DNA-binding MarR family transcriptional regulator